MKWAVISALFLALAGTSAQATVIANGNFEDNVIGNNSWRWFGADQVNGWDGSNLEIWRGYAGVQAYSGQQFIELNAHGSNNGAWSIFQTFQYRQRCTLSTEFRLPRPRQRQRSVQRVSGRSEPDHDGPQHC